MHLTPAGAALLDHAERLLADLAAVEEEMTSWAHGVRGRIRLGTARGVAAQLTRALATFSARFPEVELELHEEATDAMVADLHGARIDVATLASAPPRADRRLRWAPLGAEPLVLIAARHGALGGRRRMRVSDLQDRDLVLYGRGSAIRASIVAALDAAGVVARVRYQTREYNTARILASQGLAVAIVPEAVAREPGHPVTIVRLQPEPMWSPVLAWSAVRRPAPALAAFIDFILHDPDGAVIGSR